jgi:hypothetical protein
MLTKGKKYTVEELPDFIRTSDIKSVGEWMDTPIENIIFRYDELPISQLQKQIDEMEGTYDEFPKDRRRTTKILNLFKDGEPVLPVFIEEGDKDLFVMEGRHRMVAMK